MQSRDMTVLVRGLVLLAASLAGACASPAGPEPPTLVFVVLDNVRSDRLSFCGYGRPTSPFLEQLCGRDGSQCTCDAQAPSSWTLPTHASYFTGTEVAQHGAGKGGIGDGNVRLAPGTHARPLDSALPTLAERLAARGYQTVAVSGNPLVSPASGLTRGFDVVHHALNFGSLYGADFVERLGEVLAQVDPERPLFLFLNIADAHRPWFGIPEGMDWLPPRRRLSFPQKPGRPNRDRRRYVTGQITPAKRAYLLEHLGDVYDFGVRRADNTLRGTLRLLRETGWIEGEGGDFRVVITSDHGEHLGDHGLMGHAGPYLFEELTRVPLAVWGTKTVRELPRQISALVSHDLILDGQPQRRPVRSMAFASDTWPQWYGPEFGSHAAAAIWRGDMKVVNHDGQVGRFDLATDPGELDPQPDADEESTAEIEALLRALESVAAGEAPDEEMLELLRSLGYV
jgi:arylsulfatase A-like enzyme